MRRILHGLIAVVARAGAGRAQEVLPPEPGIETTIRSQVDAFLRDDPDTAFRHAAPSSQGMFGTPENLGAMVRNGYPMVWRPEECASATWSTCPEVWRGRWS